MHCNSSPADDDKIHDIGIIYNCWGCNAAQIVVIPMPYIVSSHVCNFHDGITKFTWSVTYYLYLVCVCVYYICFYIVSVL